MARPGPEAAPRDVVVDGRSVRAERGGEPTGPDPAGRGEAGTKRRVVISTGGVPPGVAPSAADVHDGTRLLPHLPRLAPAVCAAVGGPCADAARDSADDRRLRLRDGVRPRIREPGEPRGSGLGTVRRVVGHGRARPLADKGPDRRQDRLGRLVRALPHAACILIIANRVSGS